MNLNHSNFKLFCLYKASPNKQHGAGKKFYQRPLIALSRGSPQVPIADIGNARNTGHFGAQRKIVPSACAC